MGASAAGGPSGVLLLDKTAGFSSTQALARAKRLLGAAKAGHTGTLDPFATGLLPLAFGEATKFSRFLIDSRKSYEATLCLGKVSTTGDPEGVVSDHGDPAGCIARVDDVLRAFVGVQEQTPPMHSAVHVNGRRLYEYARAGEEVARASRRIEIESLEKLSVEGSELRIAVTCSKGTYVRSLAADIGIALGCGAYLTGLRRTAAGPFHVRDAATLEELGPGMDGARSRLLPTEVLVASLPRTEASREDAWRFTRGQAIALDGAQSGSEWALFAPDGRFLGVGRAEAAGRLAPLRLMATESAAKSPDFA
jgi:tRNA pseudouridine55 synthase